jgi:hypothetical protein
MMNCPKCGHHQGLSDECVKCGIIFERFRKIDASKKEARTAHKIEATNRTFTKLWLYPIIALLSVVLLCRWFPERSILLRPLSIYLFFGIPALFFGIAGIKNLIKEVILRRKKQGDWWAIPLATGFLLNGALIVLTLWVGIGDYNHRQDKKRYNTAVDHIQQIHYFIIDYLSIPSNVLPTENEGLVALRSLAPDRFPKEASLIDPWGKPYRCRLEKNSFYIWSSGPDRLFGTDDDIDSNSRRFRWHYYHWPAA